MIAKEQLLKWLGFLVELIGKDKHITLLVVDKDNSLNYTSTMSPAQLEHEIRLLAHKLKHKDHWQPPSSN